MPPKGKPKGKGKKGGKDKKGKGKGKKKGFKIPKKYANLMFDDEYIAGKPRDQLEVIAVSIMNAVDLEREERIRYQMERDYLAELNEVYLPKLIALRIARELKTTQMNRALQDLDDEKTIKAQEAKHFRYETQLRESQNQMKDHLRQKRIKQKLQDFLKFSTIDIQELEEKLAAFPNIVAEESSKKRESLPKMDEYISHITESRNRYAKELAETAARLKDEVQMMDFFEVLEVKERFYDLVLRHKNDFEWLFLITKNYYLDTVHNMLNVIVLMLDHWDETELDCRFFEEQKKRYDQLSDHLQKKLKQLHVPHMKARINHATFVRLNEGLSTTYKGIRHSEKELSLAMTQYRLLNQQAAKLNEERRNYRVNAPDVCRELLDNFAKKFGTDSRSAQLRSALHGAAHARERQRQFHKTAVEADAEFYSVLEKLNESNNEVRDQRERSMKILKQHDDMFRSCRDRLTTVGNVEKHPLPYPISPIMIGRMRKLGPQPAGLVAASAYKYKPLLEPKPPLRWCGSEKYADVNDY